MLALAAPLSCLLSLVAAMRVDVAVAGSCKGGFMCEDLMESSCKFRTGCTWSTGTTVPGVTSTCQGGMICEGKTNQKDCEFFSSCSWGAPGSSSGTTTNGGTTMSSFCFAKIDGGYCQGNYAAVVCKDGKQTQYQYCSAKNCAERFREASCGNPTFCSAKMDGNHCDGKVLVTCSDNKLVSSSDCRDAGCDTGIGIGKAACGSATFCNAKLEGQYCDSGAIKSCPSGAVSTVCRDGTCQESLRKATCGDPLFCKGKIDGQHCDGKYLKTCEDSQETHQAYCGGTCSDGFAGRAECGTANYCNAKLEGSYCDGMVLKTCKGSLATASRWCEGGCRGAGASQAECGAGSGNLAGASALRLHRAAAAAAALAAACRWL